MIVLSAKNIGKTYGTDVILENVSFHLNKGDRVGIIGANGAGKTTLLKILTGEMNNDSGEYFISENMTIGYLKQHDSFESENTVYEEVEGLFTRLHEIESEMTEISMRLESGFKKTELSMHHENGSENKDLSEIENADNIMHAEDGSEYKTLTDEESAALLKRYDALQQEYEKSGGYTYKSEITGILKSMAFGEDYYGKKISTLSGGERTRLAMACLLLKKPDLLFLDEPTNHLDIGTLRWLEQYLRSYTGTIMIVSHDRYFLDQTVNRIFEIENHKLRIYEGGYSHFAVQKKQQREADLRKYRKQQTEIKRQEDMIRRYKQRGTEKLAKRAQSREKRLDAIERVEKPDSEGRKMKISFKENFKSGNDVLFGEKLAKGFGYASKRKTLFTNVGFDIKRGEKICIVGPNGVGKTTLLRIMLQELEPDEGRLKIGHNVDFGYYDQEQAQLCGSNTVLEELKEAYRLYTDTEMRSVLGRFLFVDDDVFLQINSLSGGEKARLSLVKLMLSGANVLILDEPTNHLDISSKEVFEEALLDFPGTVITVSHDRYFLNKIPTRILELTQGGITEYLGKYDYYQEKKQQIESGKKYLAELQQNESEKIRVASMQRNESGKAGISSMQRNESGKAGISGMQRNESGKAGISGMQQDGAKKGSQKATGQNNIDTNGSGKNNLSQNSSSRDHAGKENPDRNASGQNISNFEIPYQSSSNQNHIDEKTVNQSDPAQNTDELQWQNLSSQEQRKLKKEKEAQERRLKRIKEKLEKEIEELESKCSEIEAEMSRPEIMSDHEKLTELSNELNEYKDTLDSKYDEWLEI